MTAHTINGAVDIPIKYHSSPTLEQTEKGGCVDLYSVNEIMLHTGEWGFINLGVSMALPEGFDALILPRSSTFKRYGILLTNSIGL